MPFTIKVDMPNLSPGDTVQVHGLGSLENGKTVRISDEQAAMFMILNGSPVNEVGADGKPTGATIFKAGPPPDEANFPEGVVVTREGSQNVPQEKEDAS